MISTYKPDFNYFCISKYLENHFLNKLKLQNVFSSRLCVDLKTYYNMEIDRDNSVILAYYPSKPGRLPELVSLIIEILSTNNIKCYVYPYNYSKIINNNIINLGLLNTTELNKLYNSHKIGIIFSNSNPSRLGFEMYASGLHVIEYDSEFTKYDMPLKYFTKIKDSTNILNIVDNLFKKEYNNGFLTNIDCNKDYLNFKTFIDKMLK